jgi:hypothetical protein
MTQPRWRKSSRSTSGDSCVELAHTLFAIRDSKCPDGPTLNVPVAGLLATIRADRLDR